MVVYISFLSLEQDEKFISLCYFLTYLVGPCFSVIVLLICRASTPCLTAASASLALSSLPNWSVHCWICRCWLNLS